MNVQNIQQNLSELTDIQDNAMRLLYLRDYMKAYSTLSESEKEALRTESKALAQKLIAETNAILGENIPTA
ncbi:MAG: hypothetical protein EAZ95_05810 [Bacteroidetes bacterium]|nr:MAG: hypothetical protein EAZ95_05810 [Bacteroidota bacterium]